ncbi:MAG: hypothetical protein QXX08_06375 [Candidatus Bathyarchaeia archaeon]
MKAEITDVSIFRALFQYLARFIEVAHFDVKKDMMRVRSIDPHDFCYVDIILYPNFFEKYEIKNEQNFSIDCSKLSTVLSTLTASKIFIKTSEDQIQFSTQENWLSSFNIKWLRPDPYNLPEPNIFDYEATLEIPAGEIADLIYKASAISHEITFSVSNPNELTIFAAKENYAFVAKPNDPYFKMNVKNPAHVSTIVDYLKTLRYFMKKCESAKIFIGNEKPFRVDLKYKDKGIFSFSFSHKREEETQKAESFSRDGTSLPRISMKTFEKYVVQLSKFPEGADPKIFEIAGLETKGGDCLRLSSLLTLAYRDKKRIKLTPIGEAFVSLHEKDENKAKQFLHILARNTIMPYKIMVEKLKTPTTLDNLKEQINAALKLENRHSINGQDLSTLIEIAKWCGILKIKEGLLSFKSQTA